VFFSKPENAFHQQISDLYSARNYLAGVIDAATPWNRSVRRFADGIMFSTLGVTGADENSAAYTGGTISFEVAAFLIPGPGGKLKVAQKLFRRNIGGVIQVGGSNIGRGFQLFRGSIRYMQRAAHRAVHTLPHHQIEIGRFVIRHVIGTPIWRWTRGPF
jgi:hypothetical protein